MSNLFAVGQGRPTASDEQLIETVGVTRLCNVTGLDNVGVPTYLAIRPDSRSLVVSVGKSLSAAIARTGALMESCEAWHAERRVVVVARGAWADVSRAHRAVDPRDLPSAIGRHPRPDEVFDWTAATDLLTGDDWLLPSAYVSLDFRVGVYEDVQVARSSNGLSAGASDAHALRHGLLEVLERAAEDTWRTTNDSRRVDLDTVLQHRHVGNLLNRIGDAGLYLAVWDITDRTGVPCFAAVVLSAPSAAAFRTQGPHDGFCCHPDPTTALTGAILEALQKRLTYIAGSRDDLSTTELVRATNPDLAAAVWQEVTGEQPVRTMAEVRRTSAAHATPAEQLTDILRVIQAAGSGPVLAVDLTDPLLGLAVWKVVVPGAPGPFGSADPPARLHPLWRGTQ